MLKEARNRTDKVFKDYNDYHDRGMIKWVTAYAMDELTKSIAAGNEEAMKAVPVLPQMSSLAIDKVLSEALRSNRPVSIQLNQKDRFGRQTESVVGHFKGYRAENDILIGEEWVTLETIRNVQILYEDKWFKVDVFRQAQKKEDTQEKSSPHFFDSEEQGFSEMEVSWVEDFYQDDEWIE